MFIIHASYWGANYVNWDEMNWTGMSTDEFWRSWLAAYITFVDFGVVTQDWEFPTFDNAEELSLVGLPWDRCNVMGCSGFEDIPFCGRKEEDCGFIITGKWFNYSIVFLVMILDFNNYKNQIVYHPNYFAQYTDRNYYVWSMTDEHEAMAVKPLFDQFAVNTTLPWTPENTAAWAYCRGCCTTAPHAPSTLVNDPDLGLALPASARCDHQTKSKFKSYTNWEMKSSFFFICVAMVNFFGQLFYIGGYNFASVEMAAKLSA